MIATAGCDGGNKCGGGCDNSNRDLACMSGARAKDVSSRMSSTVSRSALLNSSAHLSLRLARAAVTVFLLLGGVRLVRGVGN